MKNKNLATNETQMSGLSVEVYSEKAIVVRNTLEHHGPIMEQLGGTFNEKLKGGRGWIFSKFKMTQVRNVVDKLNSGQYGNEYEQKSAPSLPADSVSKTEFLSVLSRVERLEALVANLCAAAMGQSVKPIQMSIADQSVKPIQMSIADQSVKPIQMSIADQSVKPIQVPSVKPTFSKPVAVSRVIEEEDLADEMDEPPMERKRLVAIRK